MSHRIGKWKLVFLLLLAAGSVYVVLTDRKPSKYITDKGVVFGTTYQITYSYHSSIKGEIEQRLAKVDSSLSPFNKKSIITAVNQNRPVRVDTMFAKVFTLSGKVSEQTGGAFDITVAPLVNAWGFGFNKSQDVNETAIDSMRRFVGFNKVRIDASGRVVKSDPRVMRQQRHKQLHDRDWRRDCSSWQRSGAQRMEHRNKQARGRQPKCR